MGCLLRYLKHLGSSSKSESNSSEDILNLIEGLNLEYVDNRNLGGALWVIGGRELWPTMGRFRSLGFSFVYKAGGGKSSNYRNAWWYKAADVDEPSGKEVTSEPTLSAILANVSTASAWRVDFSHPELCAQTHPLICTIKGRAVAFQDHDWRQLLIAVSEHFIAENNPNLAVLDHRPIYGSMPFFLNREYDSVSCALLSNGKWIYLNSAPLYNATMIKLLCQHCGVELDEVVIICEPTHPTPELAKQENSQPEPSTSTAVTPPHVVPDTIIVEESAEVPESAEEARSASVCAEPASTVLSQAILDTIIGEELDRAPKSAEEACPAPVCAEPASTVLSQAMLDTIIGEEPEGAPKSVEEACPAPACAQPASTVLSKAVLDTIIGEERANAPKSAEGESPAPLYADPKAHTKPVPSSVVIEILTKILSTRFANGFRLNSPIELARLRSFATDDLGEIITLSDEELKRNISTCGMMYEGKVYVVSDQTKERIKALAVSYFKEDASVIFYAEFYAKHEHWLFGASVISEDMLIDILRKLFPKLSFTQTYFGYSSASINDVLKYEILRVWGDDVLLNYEQLAKRLQYIPLERIKHALGQNGDFIWSSVETFSHISKITITHAERKAIREAARRECDAHGYISLADLPLGEIEERNFELSNTAIHTAVYNICLSDRFDKNGKIVTRIGETLDALTIMKDYCRTVDRCTLDDLLNFEKELTGQIYRRIPLEAGCAILVRTDKNSYVAEKYVHFDHDAIDNAIELFVTDDYLPLKAFTTFGAFPACGQTWNLFLLESYCRRFSRRFRFDAPVMNSRNAGVVIRKSCGMSYEEIMTDAVAKSEISLEKPTVESFLFEAGYTGKTTSKVDEIMKNSKALREKRV